MTDSRIPLVSLSQFLPGYISNVLRPEQNSVAGIQNDALSDRDYIGGVLCPRCRQRVERLREAEAGVFDSDQQAAIAHDAMFPYASLSLHINFTDNGPVVRWKPHIQSEVTTEPQRDRASQIPDDELPTLAKLDDDQEVTAKEAAKALRIGYDRFNALVRAGEVGYIDLDGRGRRFRVRDLRAYAESRLVKPRSAKPVIDENLRIKKETTKTKKSAAEWREEMKDW